MTDDMIQAVALDLDSLHPQDLDLSVLLTPRPSSVAEGAKTAGVTVNWTTYGTTQPDQVIERLAEAHVVVANKVVIDAQVLHQLPNLKCVLIAATGTNNVELSACFARGIQVCHVRDYGAQSVAQHAITLMLALAGSVPQYHDAVRQGQWANSPYFCMFDFPVIELTGKTLGIVGYGAIGCTLARLAHAFGMHIVAAASSGSGVVAETVSGVVSGAEASSSDLDNPARMPLRALLSQADFVSLHCPLTAQTHHLMDAEAFALMKPSAFLINTGRGPLVETHALLAALREGRLAGAGLDVLSQEPPLPTDPLINAGLKNLIITPHMAWTSVQARQNIIDQVAESFCDWVAGRSPARLLNPVTS